MRGVLVGGVIPAEIMMSVSEIDVGFLEDRCPLKWSLQGNQ